MRKLFFVVSLFLLSVSYTDAQLSRANFTALKRSEDTMKVHARKMIMDLNASQRFIADSIFIRTLVKTLRTPYSFNYPFDSLQTVSRLYAPDSSFRIFSWEYNRDDNFYRQRGAIQMRTDDGSLKLFPLIDMSDYTSAPDDSVRTPQNWIGAIYYGIIMKTYNNKKYYTLLGFDDNNMRSTKKWIEVLSFDNAGRPVFGGHYFTPGKSDPNAATIGGVSRFSIEYKKEGKARMNYDQEMDMIVYDHLISEDNHPDLKYTMVPDGDYEGFKWTDGRWVHVDKVFDFKLKDGEAPMPAPLKDAEGKSDEEQLLRQSEKNGLKLPPPSKITPAKKTTKKGLDRQPRDQQEY